jgi:hypothetical protein
MSRLTRRSFVVSVIAASAGCAMGGRGASRRTAPARPVRPPGVGQTWRYKKFDLFTGKFIDTQTDRVASVGKTIDIESQSDTGKEANPHPSWGAELLNKYLGTTAATAVLPSEIQDPWGMLLVDPHWGQPQVYETAVPAWPTTLQPGWRTHIQTYYKTPAGEGSLPWEQTMEAQGWEKIAGPAGEFDALRYTNLINYTHPDSGRTNSRRRETGWFAPEVGRWVARESSGTYYLDESVDDSEHDDGGYRWQLIEWQ